VEELQGVSKSTGLTKADVALWTEVLQSLRYIEPILKVSEILLQKAQRTEWHPKPPPPPSPAVNPTGKLKLFICEVPFHVGEDDLRKMVSEHGEIQHLRLLKNTNGTSKGCGFITFRHEADALQAIAALHGKMLPGFMSKNKKAVKLHFASDVKNHSRPVRNPTNKKGGHHESSGGVLSKRLLVAMSVAITSLRKCGANVEAITLFWSLKVHAATYGNVPPPKLAMYNSVITACGDARMLNDAFEIYKDMCESDHPHHAPAMPPDVITYSALISACEKCGQADKAFEVFDDMAKANVQPNAFTYSALISACEKEGRIEEALRVLTVMTDSGVAPNVVTYGALLSVCKQRGDAETAMSLFRKMKRSGLTPNVITYTTLIATLSTKGDRYADALEVFEEMHQFAPAVDVIAYNAMISACGKSDAVDKAFKMAVTTFQYGDYPPSLLTEDLFSWNSWNILPDWIF
jgi:pentatricopeptide repeat protein